MAAREALHQLVDDLLEEDVRTAERLLAALVLTRDPVLQKLLTAPVDDEPDRDDDDGGLTEARREVRDKAYSASKVPWFAHGS
jgi:hypothetical protein